MPSAIGAPTRVLTFLFCDIEGSTGLLDILGESEYRGLIEQFRGVMRGSVAKHSGHEIGTEGDGYFASFDRPSEAIAVAEEAQLAITAARWPTGQRLLVRMGVHTGEASEMSGTLIGMGLHVGARVMAAAHGGQVLVSDSTAALVRSERLGILGKFHLKDVREPIALYQLDIGSGSEFPPPKTLDSRQNNLSDQITSFIGRDQELSELKELVRSRRLVTLMGPGGIGKTRLAVEAAFSLLEDFQDGVWFVELSSIHDSGLVPSAIADVLGRSLSAGGIPRLLGDATMLLILDNSEHLIPSVTEAASQIISRCPNTRILATSRQPLGIVGEQTYLVSPLSLEAETGSEPDAVRFFLERALENDPSLSLGEAEKQTLVELCQTLDCMPLALELAASKLRTMGLAELRVGLHERMRMLGDSAGTPRNLRSVLDWSYDALEEHDKALLRRLSVFAGAFGHASAGAVCGSAPLTPDVGESLHSLVLRSLVQKQTTLGETRYRLLEIVREYAEEKLVESKETSRITWKYVDHFGSRIDLKELTSQRRDPREWFSEDELSTSRNWRSKALMETVEMASTGFSFFASYVFRLPERLFGDAFGNIIVLRFAIAIFSGAVLSEVLSLPVSAWNWVKVRPITDGKPFSFLKFVWEKVSNVFEILAFLGITSLVIWFFANKTSWWWVWVGLGLPLLGVMIFMLVQRMGRRSDISDIAVRSDVTRLARAAGAKVERIVESKPEKNQLLRERPKVLTQKFGKRGTRVSLNQAAMEADPGVRRALVARELARDMPRRDGRGWRNLRRIVMTLRLTLVFGMIEMVISSSWVLNLGGVASLEHPDSGALVASVAFLSVFFAEYLRGWISKKRVFRSDLIAAAITREPEAFANSLRDAMVETKSDLSPFRRFGLKADPTSRIAVVSEWEKAQRSG